MKKQLFFIIILAVFIPNVFAYDFTFGNLCYTIISSQPPRVSLDGHIDGTEAQGELVIPETVTYNGITYTVTRIGLYAFSDCKNLIGNLLIPNTVDTILSCAFRRCNGFTGDLVIPNNVKYLGSHAFERCYGFDGQLVLSNSINSIRPETFSYCIGFTGALVIPESVVELSVVDSTYAAITICGAFHECIGFTDLVLSNSLKIIGHSCFYLCSGFTGELVIPNSVVEIQEGAFFGCNGFTGELHLPDSLRYIGMNAFNDCDGFNGRLVLPAAVERIEEAAFSGCKGFSDVELHHQIFYEGNFGPALFSRWNITNVDIPEGWTITGDRTFAGCFDLQSVHLPNSLTTISMGTFLHCSNLKEINIPESVKKIENNAFANCDNLENIMLPRGLQDLYAGVFQDCTSLDGEFVIPDLVKVIWIYLFDGCVNLDRVVLGDSVKTVYDLAFRDCQLESLVLKSVTPPEIVWNPNHYYLPDTTLIIVPCGSLEAYQNSESWNRFTNITEDCGDGSFIQPDSEWYYEILNDDGCVTYQHLEYVADTTVSHKDVKIIIRNNTLYDKTRKNVITKEYLYEENNKLYWWNPSLQNFTLLYDFNAEPGDEWTIHVGTESLTVHVDAVGQYYYDGRLHKMLRVSDPGNLFSGEIVYGIGHLTSFFPERLMTRGKDYRVEGIRCFWQEGELVFQNGEKDCDEVYEQYHSGLEETSSDGFRIYPNPTDGLLVVETFPETSPTELGQHEYRVTNLIGQTLLTGLLTAENHQINVSSLPDGLYFITIGNVSTKLIIRH